MTWRATVLETSKYLDFSERLDTDCEAAEHREQSSRKTSVQDKWPTKGHKAQWPWNAFVWMQALLRKTQTVSWPKYSASRKKGILPMGPPLWVFKPEVHSLLTHKAYRWTQCNSLHHFSQWKSHMCAFPSVSWPAWTWLAGCLEKFMTLIKQCGLSERRVLCWLRSPGWQFRMPAGAVINHVGFTAPQ